MQAMKGKKDDVRYTYYMTRHRSTIAISGGILILTAGILLAMGRVPWCECGTIKLWHGSTWSSENSQHLMDWYTPSHLIHGILFFWILRRWKRTWTIGKQFLIALLIEVGWEILENSPLIINRYRETTISLDYYGDSVINSIADIVAMIFGFWLVYRAPTRVMILLVLGLELFVGYNIRDNLALNIVMLLYPFEFIKNWQMAIAPPGM